MASGGFLKFIQFGSNPSLVDNGTFFDTPWGPECDQICDERNIFDFSLCAQVHNFFSNFKPYAQPPPKCGPWKSTSNWNDLNKYFISRRWHQIPITAQSPYCTQWSELISEGNFLRIRTFLQLWLVSQDNIHKTLIVLQKIYKTSHEKILFFYNCKKTTFRENDMTGLKFW